MNRLSFLLALVIALLASCTKYELEQQDLTGTARLTVAVVHEEETLTGIFPIQVVVRTTDATTSKGQATITESGQTATFDLPVWMCYQIVVQAANRAFASTECALMDAPRTIVLKLSGSGHGSTEDTISISLDSTTTMLPIERPEPLTYYEGHIIVFSDSITPTETDLTLISRMEWEAIPSANNTENPNRATNEALQYDEMGLTGWHIPTIEEAKRLKNIYGSDKETHAALKKMMYSDILSFEAIADISIEKDRFLCDEGHKSFAFAPSTTIATAGSKANYHMRLLRTIRISTKR